LLVTGHKVLIFFQMTKIMTIMQDFLDWRGIASLRLDGSTSDDDRREYMHTFNKPDSPYKVFMLSTRAGGQGLNLQTADTVVIFDSDWNPSADAQAMDRAHRIGQENEVRILRLISRGTVEEDVLARAEHKRDLDGKVIQAGKFDNKTSSEERERLLRSLLRAKEAEAEEMADAEAETNPDDELNEMIARSDEERIIFARMDMERRERELAEWREAGHATSPPPERLITDSELPEEYLQDYDPAEEKRKAEEEATRDKSRNTRRVYYDDGLSEEQWLDALEDDNADIDDIVNQKRERAERKRKRIEERLLQQHLSGQQAEAGANGSAAGDGGGDYGEGENDEDGDSDANVDADADDDDDSDGDHGRVRSSGNAARSKGTRDAAALSTPRKRGRPRLSANGAAPTTKPPSNDGGSVAGRRKRPRLAGADLDDDDVASASASVAGAMTPTSTPARKARRKTGAADMLSSAERARMDEIFEASFAAVEACVDEEYGRRRCDLFLELPSRRDYPDYYVIIRQPIAMKNIRRNVKAHKYAQVADFHRDWKLMFDNARTYNEEGSMVYDDACQMQRALEDKLNEMTGENYRSPVGTQSPLHPTFAAAIQQQQLVVTSTSESVGSGAPISAMLSNPTPDNGVVVHHAAAHSTAEPSPAALPHHDHHHYQTQHHVQHQQHLHGTPHHESFAANMSRHTVNDSYDEDVDEDL
ncbi:ATP-dependent DNA helicase Snf21, partial [Kickxella alabastrina]